MNRNQRKKLKEDKEKQQWRLKLNRGSKVDCVQTDPDFSAVPLATICQSILLLIKELRRRGFPVYDFDHKNKYLQGIKIIQGKIYFLAAEEEDRT